jgi:hypothetical protein
MADQELERFKTEIDLCAFAASLGYERDGRESSQNCEVMRNSNGDKVVIVKHLDNKGAEHWVYYCVRDERDNGTIIDFLQWRGGGTLGQIRQTLRPWVGKDRREVREYQRPHKLRPVSRNRAALLLEWEQATPIHSLPYLVRRGLGPEVMDFGAFLNCARVDHRGNVLFPHFDEKGLCGFEIKNAGFTGFSVGGSKGLWYSKTDPAARTLVFCESAIDAMSYYVLNHSSALRVMSTGGAISALQLDLIRRAMEKLPAGSRVVLAFDADEGGDDLAAKVLAVAPPSVFVHRELPPVGMGKDWNDALKYQRGIIDRPTATVGPDHGKTPPPVDMRRYHQKTPKPEKSAGNRKKDRR